MFVGCPAHHRAINDLAPIEEPVGHDIRYVGQEARQPFAPRIIGVARHIERLARREARGQEHRRRNGYAGRHIFSQKAIFHAIALNDPVDGVIASVARWGQPEERVERLVYQ